TRRRARPPVLPVLPTAIDLTPLARPSAGTVHATRCHTKVCATSRRVNCVLGTVFDVPADRKADEPPASDGRATRWNDHKARRRGHILDSAVEVISEKGSDVGVQQIAERAGVPRSVIYRHFAGRGDLDERIRERIVDHLLEAIGPALDPRGTVREAIDQAVGSYVQWIIDVPRLHHFLGIGSAKRRTVGSRV